MRNDNYPSSSQIARNLAQVSVPYEQVLEDGKFRVVKLEAPYWQGYEFWVVNEKGFLWEPADTLKQAEEYLASSEAQEYNLET
ncbi:MAG: hypothetical protein JSS72_10035 [Armatimonadetes bacterium]|nr:hypothetical protein [Armatimonadota bacterium]